MDLNVASLPLDVLAWYYQKSIGRKVAYVNGEFLISNVKTASLLMTGEWSRVHFPSAFNSHIPDECLKGQIRLAGGGGAWVATLQNGKQYHGASPVEAVMRAAVGAKFGAHVPPPWEPSAEQVAAGARLMPEISTRLLVGGEEQHAECAALVYNAMASVIAASREPKENDDGNSCAH